jgi:hypothetical protein
MNPPSLLSNFGGFRVCWFISIIYRYNMYIPFLLCREKRYVEENTVQQAVMIPAKEVKLIIYQVGKKTLLIGKSAQEMKTTTVGVILICLDLNDGCYSQQTGFILNAY